MTVIRSFRSVRHRTALLCGVATTLAVALSGCSSSSGTSDGTSAAHPATTDARPAPGARDSATPQAKTTTETASATDSAPPVASLPNACDLVTAAEAASALGAPVGPGMHASGACYYKSASRQLVAVIVRKVPKALFDASAKKSRAVAVTDIGADAYQAESTVQFWKSGIQVAIGVDLHVDGTSDLGAEKQLARLAAGRL